MADWEKKGKDDAWAELKFICICICHWNIAWMFWSQNRSNDDTVHNSETNEAIKKDSHISLLFLLFPWLSKLNLFGRKCIKMIIYMPVCVRLVYFSFTSFCIMQYVNHKIRHKFNHWCFQATKETLTHSFAQTKTHQIQALLLKQERTQW